MSRSTSPRTYLRLGVRRPSQCPLCSSTILTSAPTVRWRSSQVPCHPADLVIPCALYILPQHRGTAFQRVSMPLHSLLNVRKLHGTHDPRDPLSLISTLNISLLSISTRNGHLAPNYPSDCISRASSILEKVYAYALLIKRTDKLNGDLVPRPAVSRLPLIPINAGSDVSQQHFDVDQRNVGHISVGQESEHSMRWIIARVLLRSAPNIPSSSYAHAPGP